MEKGGNFNMVKYLILFLLYINVNAQLLTILSGESPSFARYDFDGVDDYVNMGDSSDFNR